MTLQNLLKNCFILTILYLKNVWNRIQIFLGLMTVKYSMVGYFEFKGVVYSSQMMNEERLTACMEYDNFRPDDVILLTYPKTGTHFVAGIINSIYKEKGILPSKPLPFSPFELMPPAISKQKKASDAILRDVESASSPRIIMTHMPFDCLPPQVKDGKVKIVHCIRNPKDVLCSMFPFLKTVKILVAEATWNEFVINFMGGNVMYGSYFSFLKSWYPIRNRPSMFNLEFEDLKKDLEGNVRRLASFLGMELTNEQVDRIVVANTFANKKKEMGKGHIIYRKGKSGGWKSELTVEQNEMMDEWIQHEMEGMDDLTFQYV